ncbi:MAG: biotin/lipoyl-binding protein [Bacteroides sp.]|nr:biotin/lipoyl-binding protein [Bacteroides sp.]
MSKKTLLSIILISLFYSCSTPKENEADPQSEGTEKVDDKIVEVRARVLEYEDFNYELLSNGTIASMHRAALSFQSQEPITKIYVKNGQSVTKGQKLAELDDFKLKSSLDQATWQLELAKLDLQDVLIGQGYSLSDSAAIPAEVMKIAKIRSNYEQSYHNYKVAQYNLDASILYAPFSGVIANLTVKEYNQPGNEPFCLVIDNRNPEVVFNILENELPPGSDK